MLDKQLFNQQIASIRTRYNNLSQHNIQSNAKIGPPGEYCLSSPPMEKFVFKTPIKSGKDAIDQNSITFSKVLSPQKGQFNSTQTTGSLFGRHKRQISDRQEYRTEGYISSRQSSGVNRQMSEKEKQLTKRIEQNQRLLSMSKQLRYKSSKSIITVKNQEHKQSQNIQQVPTFKGRCPAKKVDNTYQQTIGHPDIQDIQQRGALTERSSNIMKGIQQYRDIRSTADKNLSNAKTAFNNKMNQLLENFKTTTPSQSKYDSIPLRSERRHQPMAPPISYIEIKLSQGNESFKKEDTKITSIFENTTNIQDRIKAILSYH